VLTQCEPRETVVKKRVLIIGAGAQGNVISGVLSKAEDVESVILGDIDLERARGVAEFVDPDRIEAIRIDASNVEEMTSLIAGGNFELVVNATLTDFNRSILQATVNAKTNYLDMASDEYLESSTSETVQEEFLVEQLEWAKAFEDIGKVALILAGADSGLSNIMCREAADELDEIDYIGIKDFGVVECDIPVALWSFESYLDDNWLKGIYWEDGQHKYAEPFSGAEMYDFPPPLNRTGKVVYHLHEEPITIPKFIGKPVKYCDFKLGEPDIDMWEYIINQLRMMDPEPVNIKGVMVSPRDVLLRHVPPTLSPKECTELVRENRLKSQSMFVADVKGRRAGKSLHFKLWTEGPDAAKACGLIPGANDVSWMTSIPASILSLMILRGQIEKPGVYPCETLDREQREIVFNGIREWEITVRKQVTEIA
jgi:saccharopine dehydrogenase (NAD+, L-lysine-forming)